MVIPPEWKKGVNFAWWNGMDHSRRNGIHFVSLVIIRMGIFFRLIMN